MTATDPFTLLGVAPEADDAAIRARYLELVRAFPPEQHPEKFAAIRSAFDSVKDMHSRVRRRIFPDGREDSIDQILTDAAAGALRPRITFDALLATAYPKVLR